MTSRLSAVLLPVAALLAACGLPATTETTPVPAAASSAAPSGGGWQEPADYSFAVTAWCGERMFTGDYRVHVAGGEVVASERLDAMDGEWKPVDHLQWVPTLGDMLDQVARATDAPEAGEVTLETDPADGHPTLVRVDPMADAVDDESCYAISDYRPA